MSSRDFTASWLERAKADLKRGERRSHHDLVKIHFKLQKPPNKPKEQGTAAWESVRTDPTGINNSEDLVQSCALMGGRMWRVKDGWKVDCCIRFPGPYFSASPINMQVQHTVPDRLTTHHTGSSGSLATASCSYWR